MTVYDLASVYIDDLERMQIWDIEEEKTVFDGTFFDATYCEYANYEVGSFENSNGIIVININ